ncbi:MAG: glycosyltransferase [Clostridia bacterium]|nr:glycosyltransferase [Clostridia bacterium]
MKISIITVTYNSEKTLKDTIESILSQTYKDYEHIIVDGLSKDNTIQIVKNYESKYNGKLKYISEKDTGLYDAMNKGIKMATGDIIGILNSDDIYASENTLKIIADKFKETNCDGTYADLIFMDEETMSKPQRIWKSAKGKIKNGWHPAHPTLYLKREVYDKIGSFDLQFRIVADYDFMLRMMKDENIKLEYINEVLIHMRAGGTSTAGIKGYVKNLKESHKALVKNQIKHPYFVDFKRIVKTLFQMILGLYKKFEEIIMYLIMGFLATLVSVGVKWGMLYTFLDAENGFHVQIAVVSSWIIACTFAYFTNRIWVFKSKSKKIFKEFCTFMGARVFTLLAEMLIMYIFITLLGMNSDFWVFVWTIVAQVVVVILNYIFSKLFIFKKK